MSRILLFISWAETRDIKKGLIQTIHPVCEDMTEPDGKGKKIDKGRIGLILGPLLFLIIILIPEPQSMIDAAREIGAPDYAPILALGLLVWVLSWWITECIPLGLAALLVPLIFSMSGILSWTNALHAFMDPIIWIFLAGFVLAAAFRKWELDRRISVKLASLYKGNNPMVAALFVCCLPVFLLTLTGSITASTSVVFPFLIAYLAMLNIKGKSRYAEACSLALAQAATAGAMLMLISTPPNLIAKSTVEEFQPGFDLTFLDWMIVGTPHAIIGLFVSWFIVFRFVKPEMKTLNVDREKIEKVRKELGPMTTGEKTVLTLLISAILLWFLPSIVKVIADGNPGLQGVSDSLSTIMPEAMPAVLVILLVGLIKVNKEPVLRWKEVIDGINWNVVFLFGGGIALGLGLQQSGFANWLADGVATAIGSNASEMTIFAVSALIGFALSYAASNTASALISCPIAATLAMGAHISPIPPIIAAGLACSISSAIPSTTPPMAIVYGSGNVKIWNMFKIGIVSDFLRLAALILLGPFLISLIL